MCGETPRVSEVKGSDSILQPGTNTPSNSIRHVLFAERLQCSCRKTIGDAHAGFENLRTRAPVGLLFLVRGVHNYLTNVPRLLNCAQRSIA